MHRFDMERVEDFKKSLEAFLEGMIMRQRQVRCISYVLSDIWNGDEGVFLHARLCS
jgi:Vps5 C terminal like